MADSKRKTANLLDFDALENAPSGTIGTATVTHVLILTLKPNTVYTVISNGQGSTGGSAGDNRCIYVNGTGIDNVSFAEHPVTGTTPVSGEMKIGFFSERSNAQQYINGDAQVWLVEGSDATVPYEPYWQHSLRKLTTNGWVDARVEEWDGSEWQ